MRMCLVKSCIYKRAADEDSKEYPSGEHLRLVVSSGDFELQVEAY
jgi:uncharacterized protein YaiE (UPF0345 family)